MNLIFSPATSLTSIRISSLPHRCRRIPRVRVRARSGATPLTHTGVVVVGAGLAGLAAANRLHRDNVPFLLLDSSDAVGGRVRTDIVDGFVLDRGFQIFITAYPEARKLLNYEALNLQKFYSGVLVYHGGSFHRVADPFRHFADAISTLVNPIGSVADKLLIGFSRFRSVIRSDDEILSGHEVPIIELLRGNGFSESIIDTFFRPFFGGIFFDRELETTSRLFDFIFKCLALGDNTLPANGISAVPEQLAGNLPQESVLLNCKAVSIEREGESGPSIVKLQNGENLRGDLGIIVAVEEPEAEKLLKIDKKPVTKPVRSTVCLYFSTDRSPVREPVLILNGSGRGLVNNMFFATEVAPTYGPVGKTLVSVSLIGTYEGVSDSDLARTVKSELSGWFGESEVGRWVHLKTYRIRFAQPNQSPPTDLMKEPRVRSGVYLCGDYRSSATFDGALVSGRRAAETLLKDRGLLNIISDKIKAGRSLSCEAAQDYSKKAGRM
ncbi:15-cis-phytoene desaturase, chloroplastic/chromoplastic [Aristolochia californica]|uniref:15-cis-phytoene desaturase, chloroplastic/chromoplastic n=1 Tax=Aristolochia californica TaxID=171875 RepID=UPI0035D57C22